MIIIRKYELDVRMTQYPLPRGAKLLDVQVQDDRLMLWALVDTDQPSVVRAIHCYGTGYGIEGQPQDTHLATAQHGGGVWHFFDWGQQ